MRLDWRETQTQSRNTRSAIRRAVAALTLSFFALAGEARVTAASLNLCADNILLEVAASEQIVSVSWLATDPGLSHYADRASHYPNNHGRIEELVPLTPDYIFTGANTSAVDKALLTRLGYQVVHLRPDNSLEDYKQNLLLVGRLLDRSTRAEYLVAQLDRALQAYRARPTQTYAPQTILFQANGYSPGTNSLPYELVRLGGLDYISQAYKAWPTGRFLSIEELIYQRPEVVILASLDRQAPALADLFLSHRALHGNTQWRPFIIHVNERDFNCGSQAVIKLVAKLDAARQQLSPPDINEFQR